MSNLTIEQTEAELLARGISDWEIGNKYIFKSFRFKDFRKALEFMNKAGEAAEELNHHPDWSNVYNVVNIKLYTHETDSITEIDILLAEQIEKAYRFF